MSGAVLPDPDLELAEAELGERSISKGQEEEKLKLERVDGREHDQHKQNWLGCPSEHIHQCEHSVRIGIIMNLQ